MRGCIPTKELLYSAHVVDLVREAEEFGVTTEGVKFHFDVVQKEKIKSSGDSPKVSEYLIEEEQDHRLQRDRAFCRRS